MPGTPSWQPHSGSLPLLQENGQKRSSRRAVGISAAQITGIGAFSDAVLGFFDWEKKDYRKIPVREQVEVVSFMGDVAQGPDGKPALHVHAVVSRSDGTAMGGHLLEAHVRPTLEVVLTESPKRLHKRKDPVSGLALIVPQE
jgi:uncharacterized protein